MYYDNECFLLLWVLPLSSALPYRGWSYGLCCVFWEPRSDVMLTLNISSLLTCVHPAFQHVVRGWESLHTLSIIMDIASIPVANELTILAITSAIIRTAVWNSKCSWNVIVLQSIPQDSFKSASPSLLLSVVQLACKLQHTKIQYRPGVYTIAAYRFNYLKMARAEDRRSPRRSPR